MAVIYIQNGERVVTVYTAAFFFRNKLSHILASQDERTIDLAIQAWMRETNIVTRGEHDVASVNKSAKEVSVEDILEGWENNDVQ